MQHSLRWSWLGAIALAVGPTLAAAQDTSTQSHTVRQGDTLWDLARQYRGDPFLWPEIFRLNTDVVEDPARIYPNERLVLPAIEYDHAGGACSVTGGHVYRGKKWPDDTKRPLTERVRKSTSPGPRQCRPIRSNTGVEMSAPMKLLPLASIVEVADRVSEAA